MKIKINCGTCQTEFQKQHWEVKQGKSYYCSRKCSLKNANLIKYKDHVKSKMSCNQCGCDIDIRSKKQLCQPCHIQSSRERIEKQTIGEIKTKHKNRKFVHWYSSEIRNFNRDWNRDLLLLPCQVCGYSRKVHLAHIKPICGFADSATLKEINSRENNLVLCPNHHSEFDDGYISLTDIPPRNSWNWRSR